jgi:acyl dehydratase
LQGKEIGGVVAFKQVVKNQRDEIACQADVEVFMKLRAAQG